MVSVHVHGVVLKIDPVPSCLSQFSSESKAEMTTYNITTKNDNDKFIKSHVWALLC